MNFGSSIANPSWTGYAPRRVGRPCLSRTILLAIGGALGWFVTLASWGCGEQSSECGAHTELRSGVCVADAAQMVCGAGTGLVNGSCTSVVGDGGDGCGFGTHDVNGVCVIDVAPPAYQVRMDSQEIVADGFWPVPVVVFGAETDGGPSTEAVEMSTARPVGVLAPSSFTLNPAGYTTYYLPCSALDPFCLGGQTLSLSLRSDPGSVVATSWLLTLVAPKPVGSDIPCQAGGLSLIHI